MNAFDIILISLILCGAVLFLFFRFRRIIREGKCDGCRMRDSCKPEEKKDKCGDEQQDR